MTTRGKWLTTSAMAALMGGWFVAQWLLGRHAALGMYRHGLAAQAAFRKLHPQVMSLRIPPPTSAEWVQPAEASLIALVACALTAAAIAAGGRRLWSLLPAAVPLTYFIGIGDATSLGLNWQQPFNHLSTWLGWGAVVDAVLVATIAVLLAMALPRTRAMVPVGPAVLRTLPIAIIAFGYWYVGNPFPDPNNRLFIVRTLLLVLAASVVATLELPLAVRVLALFVLPFADPNMSLGLIYGFNGWWTYVHHVAVAAGTVLYVLGAPALVRKVQDQARNSDGSARSAATSAMN